MANNGGNITFGIGFNVDKSGLNDLKKSLQDIQKATTKDLVGDLGGKNAQEALAKVKQSASQIEQALKKAYNPTINATNISKFNQQLSKTGTNLNTVYQDFSKLGIKGQTAFAQLASNILTTNVHLKQTHSLLDSMGQTMVNTVKWGIASSVMNTFTQSVQKAYNYIKVLDSSLTDIRIVTGQSRQEMDKFADSANEAAQNLGRQTKDYTNAALSFYQQGLSDDEVAARTETTLKAANITGAGVSDMANQLTAVWNGFQVSMEDTENVVSKLAAVADTSASNMSQLATAMSKAASVANNMGVDVDQLSAQIATIIATTRQAPETVGNALKTIYARINDIKAGSDEAEISLGNYTGKMARLGIQVLDQQGNLRDTGQVMEEIGDRWGTMTREQQIYLAQTMAGQRQMNNLIALFDNWDMYTKELNISLEAQGTLDRKNAIYMESLSAHMNQLTAASEDLIQSFTDADSFKIFIDLGTDALGLIADLVDSIGGGGNAILGLGSIATSVFGGVISKEINALITNFQNAKFNAEQLNQVVQNTKAMASIEGIFDNRAVDAMVEMQQETQKYYSVMSEQEINQQNNLIKQLGLAQQRKMAWQDSTDKAAAYAQQIANINKDDLFTDDIEKAEKLGNAYLEIAEKADIAEKALSDFRKDRLNGEDLTESYEKLSTSLTQLAKSAKLPDNKLKELNDTIQSVDPSAQNADVAIRKLIKTANDFITGTQASNSNLQNVLHKSRQEVAALDEQIKNYRTTLEQNNDSFAQVFNIQNIVSAIGAVGQLTFSLNSLSRISTILNDDNLTATEKIRQTLLNLASALPMLISGYTKLNNTLKINQSLQAIIIAFSKKKKKEIAEQIVLEKALQISHQKGYNLHFKNISSLNAQQKAILSNTFAKEVDIATTEKQIATNYALQASFGILLIAVTAAVGAFALISRHMQETRKTAIQTNQAIIDQAKAAQQQADANKQLYDNFTELFDQYKKGLITKQDLYQVTNDLAKAYNIQGSALAALSGQYDNFAESVEKARKEQLEQQIQRNRLAITSGTQNMIQSARQGTGRKVGENYYFSPASSFEIGYGLSDENRRAAQIYAQTAGVQYTSSSFTSEGQFMPSTLGTKSVDFTKPEQILKYYQALQESLVKLNQEGLTGTKVYQRIQEELNQMSEAYNQASDSIRSNQQNVLELAAIEADLVRADTQEDFEKAINQIRKRVVDAANQGLIRSDTDIEGLVENYVRELNTTFARQYLANATVEAMEKIPQTVKDAFQKLPPDTKSLMLQAGFTFDQNTTVNQVEAAAKAVVAKTGYAEVPANLVIDASSTILKGKDLSKDTFEALQSSFSPQLSAQLGDRETFNNKTIADRIDLLNRLTSAQIENNRAVLQNIEAIEQANEKARQDYENNLDNIKNQLQSLYSLRDNLQNSGQVNTEAFNSLIKAIGQLQDKFFELSSKKYIVDVGVNIEDVALAQLNTSIANVITDAQRLKTAAELVGQSWTVAAENVGQFASLFPQLMQEAERYTDGSIGLDKERAAAVLSSNEEIINSNKQVIIQAIDDKIAQLKAENDFQIKKMEILQSLLDGTITQQQAERDLKKATIDYKNRIQQIGVQVNAEAVNQVLANAKIGQEGILQTLDSIHEAIVQISQDYSKMLSGQIVDAKGSFSRSGGLQKANVGWQVSSAVEEISKDSDIRSEDVRARIQEEIEQTRAVVEANDSAIASYEGLRSQILATSKEAVEASDRVQQGLAGKAEKQSKSKKSGGGGSDKTKSADQIEKKKLKDTQIDKYHQLDRAIKRVEEAIKDLDRAEGKTIRNGLSQTIDKQVAALEQQKGLYEQKIQLMKADLQVMQSELSALDVQFDAQGNIINYTALMIEYQTLYNQLLDEAKLLTGENQEAKLKEAESVKLKLDNLKTQMNAYEQLQDKITDAGNAIEDLLDKQEQLRIKQFKIKIDWQLDKAQAERDWNKFRKNVIEKLKDDDYLGQAKIRLQDFFSYYAPDNGGIIQELTEHVNRTRQQAEIIENGGVSSIYGRNQAQALEDLKHYTDQLMKNLQDVQQVAKEIQELYLDTIDKANDAFEDQIDAYEQIDSIIEHDMNLIQMLQPNDNEQQLRHYYELRAENNNKEIDFYRREADMWKQQMDAAESGSKEWQKFRDNWLESISQLNSAVENAVQNLLDKYKNTIQKIIKDSKDQLLGGDWQKALDEWDRAKWFDDRYLDMGTRATDVLDFVDSVNNAIQGLPAKQQQQLLNFMDSQVDKLNNLTKIRQIDLDIANKKLEVLQKQMALEDAQQNKTRLRLRRDSQGNYTYQYVADEDQVASKQQELRDALEELRQLSKQDMSDTIDQMQSKLEQFFTRAQELSETYYYDQELLREKLLELENEYFGQEGYITMLGMDYNLMQQEMLTASGAQFSELLRQQGEALAAFLGLDTSNATDNSVWQSILKLLSPQSGQIPNLLDIFSSEIIPQNFMKIGEANQQLLFGQSGMSPSWNTALGNMATNYIILTDQVVIPAVERMIQATMTYMQELQILQQVAGISFLDIQAGIDNTIGQTQVLIQANDVLIDTYQRQINAIAAVNSQIQGLCQQYNMAEQAAISAAAAAMQFWAAAQGVVADVQIPTFASSSSASASAPSVSPAAKSGGSSQSSSNSSSSGGGGSYRAAASTTDDLLRRISGGAKSTNFGAGYFATGGYTGEWVNGDNQGKLAFLHQKQIVLNAKDTENLLSVVDIVRGIVDKVSSLNGLVLGDLRGPQQMASQIQNVDNSNNFEQSVVINANFPDVSDAAQIKRAFNNLVNIATMKANHR